jgi:hypothetical protein
MISIMQNEFVNGVWKVLSDTVIIYRGCIIMKLPSGEYTRGGKVFDTLKSAQQDLDKKFINWNKRIKGTY